MKVGFFKPWLYAAPLLVARAQPCYVYPMVQLVRYSLQNVSQLAVHPLDLRGYGQLPVRLVATRTFRTAIENNLKLFLAVRSWSCWRC